MMVMREEDISLKGPKRVFQRDEGRLPVVDKFQIGEDFEEVLVPPRVIVAPQGSGGVFDLGLIVVDARDKDDGDDMVRVHLPPLVEERGQEGVHDLLVVALAVAREFPKLAADLYKDRDLSSQRAEYSFGCWSDKAR